MTEERTWTGWPPPRRWFITTGVAVAVAACAGIAVGLATGGHSKKSSAKPAITAASPAAMTGSSFTASRVGVACQVAGDRLVCSRAGSGRATLTKAGKVLLEPEGAGIQGGPALAPGQDWAGIGLRCTEESGGLHCALERSDGGFFVDATGFRER